MGKLYAISDLHLSHKFNLEAFQAYFEPLPKHKDAETTSPMVLSSPADYISEIPIADLSLLPLAKDNATTKATVSPRDYRADGLILAGDVSEKLEHLRICFHTCSTHFQKVWWVPGNHELYTLPGTGSSSAGFQAGSENPNSEPLQSHDQEELAQRNRDREADHTLRGEAKYLACCSLATEYGVLTPEDPFEKWEYEVPSPLPSSSSSIDASGTTEQKSKSRRSVLVCPLFTLYDYSFRPAHVSREEALDWALQQNVQATDEALLHPDPYPSRDEWSATLTSRFASKLAQATSSALTTSTNQIQIDQHKSENEPIETVLINHWPLLESLVTIPLIPRFSLWCGTKTTHDWHRRFNARAVVTGHLHVRRTDWVDNTRFEEVSLGYPRQWEGVRSTAAAGGRHGLAASLLSSSSSSGPGPPTRATATSRSTSTPTARLGSGATAPGAVQGIELCFREILPGQWWTDEDRETGREKLKHTGTIWRRNG